MKPSSSRQLAASARRKKVAASRIFKHVHHYVDTGRWGAWIKLQPEGNRIYLGTHGTEHLAARAQDRANLKFKNMEMKLNFPESQIYEEDQRMRDSMDNPTFVRMLRSESRTCYNKAAPSQCLQKLMTIDEIIKKLVNSCNNVDLQTKASKQDHGACASSPLSELKVLDPTNALKRSLRSTTTSFDQAPGTPSSQITANLKAPSNPSANYLSTVGRRRKFRTLEIQASVQLNKGSSTAGVDQQPEVATKTKLDLPKAQMRCKRTKASLPSSLTNVRQEHLSLGIELEANDQHAIKRLRRIPLLTPVVVPLEKDGTSVHEAAEIMPKSWLRTAPRSLQTKRRTMHIDTLSKSLTGSNLDPPSPADDHHMSIIESSEQKEQVCARPTKLEELNETSLGLNTPPVVPASQNQVRGQVKQKCYGWRYISQDFPACCESMQYTGICWCLRL